MYGITLHYAKVYCWSRDITKYVPKRLLKAGSVCLPKHTKGIVHCCSTRYNAAGMTTND
ncbi:MAG: hypothetical protein NVS4B11_25090 [Ktedonobacteraceae bacterium]